MTISTHRKAFTIIEVLISIGLLGIVLVALFSTVTMMRDSNDHLLGYLQKSKKITKATKILYLDIASSDGNITIKKDEFSRLCMESTRNSLYALSVAKVCWVVLKDNNTLTRIEGNNYNLPVGLEERVEVDTVINNLEIFDVYHQDDKVIVLLQQNGKKPISFMLQGIKKPIVKKVKKTKTPNDSNQTRRQDANTTVPPQPVETQPIIDNQT